MAPFCFKGGESVAEYDGEIRINTRIDTNGIIQGMSEIRQIIERNMSASKPMRNTEQEVKMLGDSFSEAAKKASDLQPKMDLKKDARVPTKEYSDLQKEFDSLQKKLLSVYNSQERFLATGGKEESSTYKKMIYDADTLEKKLQSIERAMESLVKSGKAFTFGKDSDAEYMERAKENIERVLDRVEERKKKQAQTSPELLKPKYGKPIDYEAMREAEKEIQNFIDAYVSGGKNAQEFAEKSNEAIASIAQKLSELKSRQKELEKSGIGLGFKEYDENVQKIAEINNALKDYRRGLTDTESSHERLKRSLNDLSERMTAILKPAQVFKQAFSSNGVDVSGYGRLGSAWGELKGKAIGLASTIKQVFETIKNEPTSALSAIGHFPSTFGNILISGFSVAANKVMDILSGTIGKIPNLVVDAASKTGNAFGSLTEAAKEKLAGLGGIILTSILHPFQTIKSAASSTMNGLGAALKSSLTPALESIKAKAAGMAASIINGIVHPFQTMKNIASSAIGNTSKLLSGMISTAKKVGKVISNISSMLKKASSAMSVFGKSTKSSNNMLQSGFKNLLKYGLGIRSMYALINKFRTAVKEGFGNLAQYSEPVNSALSSLKSSLTQLKNSLATAFAPILTAVAPALTALIDMVSKAATAVGMLIAALTGQKSFVKATKVQQGYADAVGNTASAAKDANKQLSSLDKLNNLTTNDSSGGGGGGGGGAGVGDMFETVDIPSKIKDLAEMIKKAWEDADFTEIGALLGTKLKDALDNIPWNKIQATAAKVGKSLATLINGFVEVEGLGYTIGKTIGEAINTGIIGINAFLDNTNWDSVGKFIGKGLNGIINTIDWKALGHMFAQKWNAIFETIGNAAKTFKWKNFGKDLASSINTFIKDFKWEENGAHLSELAKGMLDTIIVFLEKTNWQELGEKVADFVGAIDWSGIMKRLSEGIGAALGGLSAFLLGLIKDAWNGMLSYFWDYVSESLSGLDENPNLLEIGLAIIKGMNKGILNAINGIGNWIYNNIFLPFIEGFKSAFGIHSPSTVMQEQGNFIMEGLLNGISEMIDSVLEKFTEIKDKILEKWEEVKENTKEKWENIKSDLSEKWENLKESATEKFENIKQNISQKWQEVSQNTKEKWQGIKENLRQKWEYLKKNARESAKNIKDKVVENWESLKSKTKEVWNGIKNAIKSPINAIIGFINKMISGIVGGINSLIGMLNSLSVSNPLTGETLIGFNIPTMTAPQIPKLATGAVIPPNREFLAVLGDQKHGTNIEAPLSTIEEAVENVLSRTANTGGATEITIKVPVEIEGRVLFELIKKLDSEQFNRTGRPSFQM